MADRAELVLGLAQTIAEMNGVEKIEHIRNKLSMITVWASMCRAGWDRALANATTTPAGTVRPDDSAVYATKAYGGERYNDMLSYLHDISGALVLTVPATSDYDNQATHKYMEKYLRTMNGVTGEDRMKIFHLIRDISADQYGGWKKVTEQMIGGGLIAQRMNALDHYPLEQVKAKARAAAKIRPPRARLRPAPAVAPRAARVELSVSSGKIFVGLVGSAPLRASLRHRPPRRQTSCPKLRTNPSPTVRSR